MGVKVSDLLSKGTKPTKGFGARGDSRANKVVEFLQANAKDGFTLKEIGTAIKFDGKMKQMQGTIHGLKKADKVEARALNGATYWFFKQK